MADQQPERKPPKLFHSKKMDEKHRKLFNSLIRRNAKGGDHFTTIHYIKPDGSRENKEVKPYTAKKSKDGKYLLVGYSKERGEVRSYRTDRIHHIKEASLFWRGFEKRANEQYRMATHHHAETFNIDAVKQRKNLRASVEEKPDGNLIHIHNTGSKGFLGMGKKAPKLVKSYRVHDNTGGKLQSGENAPAVLLEQV